ncbi:hypothetical protein ABIF79_000717 [Bradyrhizobium japonicum]
MKLKMPPYVDRFVDRYGKARHYFRKHGGPRVPLEGLPWSAQFMAAYKAAAEGQGAVPKSAHAIVRGSVEAAIIGYLGSNDWKQQAQTSRELRKPIIEQFRTKYGVGKLRALRRSHVQQIIADKSPSAQSNWLKALRHFTAWALRENLIAADPCAGVQTARKPQTGGFKTWTEAHVTSYRAKYPLGGKPRLALELMLNLGVRISDARQIGPQHIQNGVLTDYQPQKGRTTGGHLINVPVHVDGDGHDQLPRHHRGQRLHRQVSRPAHARMVRRRRTAGMHQPWLAQALSHPAGRGRMFPVRDHVDLGPQEPQGSRDLHRRRLPQEAGADRHGQTRRHRSRCQLAARQAPRRLCRRDGHGAGACRDRSVNGPSQTRPWRFGDRS